MLTDELLSNQREKKLFALRHNLKQALWLMMYTLLKSDTATHFIFTPRSLSFCALQILEGN